MRVRAFQIAFILGCIVFVHTPAGFAAEYVIIRNGLSARSTRGLSPSVEVVQDLHSPSYRSSDSSNESCDRQREQEFCRELRAKDTTIDICECNYPLEISALPNDELLNPSVLEQMSLQSAWDIERGSQRVVVAVLDTGVDSQHPDLVGNIWENTSEIPGNGQDDDQNGYVDDIMGYDFFNGDGDSFDDNGHGTHVAGIIGAHGNNRIGSSGVNWQTRIMPLKFLGADGSGNTSNAIQAIHYAIDNGADILNLSFGGPQASEGLYQAIYRASQNGVLVIAAAGNKGQNIDLYPEYPASFPLENIISVAALDKDSNLSWFSNYGSASVDIAAPGMEIVSTIPDGKYASFSGTSMAAPFVSGIAALVLSSDPTLRGTPLRERVLRNAQKVNAFSGFVGTQGRVNAYGAIIDEVPQELVLPESAIHHGDGVGPRIVKIKATKRGRPGQVRAGEPMMLKIQGTPYHIIDVHFTLTGEFEEVDCISRTVINSRGTRVMRGRAPAGFFLKELTVSVGTDSKSVRVVQRGRRVRAAYSPLAEQCTKLVSRVH
ncbi:MAG: S8 family serine peptidase [Bdellovibrionales bacterium]|nr:S8 family serine peptidase [Bdellovibrionales bacterium]